MDEQELNKITRAFYCIDKARQRSTGGFGLYLRQLIVNTHKGNMQFFSEPDSGTKVIISLPDQATSIQ